jgi:hypothetical protein
MKNRITVQGNGNQAPYGIGEVIESYANTPAGLKKAMRHAAYWYNPATVRDATGCKVIIDFDVVRDCDKGYLGD